MNRAYLKDRVALCTALVVSVAVWGNARSAEIRGRVVSVDGVVVIVRPEGELLPSEGDRAVVYVEIPGLDIPAVVGEGYVTEAGDVVRMKTAKTFTVVKEGHRVKIDSPNPRKRGAVAAHEQRPGTSAAPANALTADERAAGWTLLFDGQTFEGWQVPSGAPEDAWKAEDGCIVAEGTPGEARRQWGYLATIETYADFELTFQWKVSAGANSGVFYRVAPGKVEAAAEYQILDNTAGTDGSIPERTAAALWGIAGPSTDVTRPVGEFNDARIVCRGTHIEHWLNGVKVVDGDTTSPAWMQAIQVKQTRYPGVGDSPSGVIVLHNLTPTAWFRNLRIRPIAPEQGGLASRPRLPDSVAKPGDMDRIPSPDTSKVMFYVFQPGQSARFGVAKPDGMILWEKNAGIRPLVSYHWSEDSGQIVFLTQCMQREADLHCPEGVSSTWVFILDAATGALLGEGDLDRQVLDLEHRLPDALEAAHVIESLKLADGWLEVTIGHRGQRVSGRCAVADLAPGRAPNLTAPRTPTTNPKGSMIDKPSDAGDYLPAAKQGNAFAEVMVRAIYGCRQQWTEWYRWEWDKGSRNGETLREFAEDFRRVKELADAGSAFHSYAVARLMEGAVGADRDGAVAIGYCRRAAEAGLARAQGHLGWCYQFGHGIESDVAKGIEWLRRGAEGGDAGAQWDLGAALSTGRGTPKDELEAWCWIMKAADAGFAPAQCSLGAYWEKGRGGAVNCDEALRWYRKAAEQGHPVAQANLRRLEAGGGSQGVSNMLPQGGGVPTSIASGEDLRPLDGWRLPGKDDVTGDWATYGSPERPAYRARADFNGDGLPDDAYIALATVGERWALFANLSSGGGRSSVIMLDQSDGQTLPQRMGISVAQPGTYKTAAGKGYGKSGRAEPSQLQSRLPAIDYHVFESASSFFWWDPAEGAFRRTWMSD